MLLGMLYCIVICLSSEKCEKNIGKCFKKMHSNRLCLYIFMASNGKQEQLSN